MFLVLLLLSILVTALATALAWRQVVRRNRVSRATPTPAPLWWLVLPSEAARMHRRLRAAVVAARLVAPAGRRRQRAPRSPIAEMVDDLEAQAVAVDLQVVAAARATARDRRQRLRALDGHVRRIEDLSARLVAAGVAASAHRQPSHQASPLDAIGERLDALEAARDELAAIEAALGLAPSGIPTAPPSTAGLPGAGVSTPSFIRGNRVDSGGGASAAPPRAPARSFSFRRGPKGHGPRRKRRGQIFISLIGDEAGGQADPPPLQGGVDQALLGWRQGLPSLEGRGRGG